MNRPRHVTSHADFYKVTFADIFRVLRLRFRGFAITYFSLSLAIQGFTKIPGFRTLFALLMTRTVFEKTVSELEGVVHKIQHFAVEWTEDYYESQSFYSGKAAHLYSEYYETDKINSAVKFVIQTEVVCFLTWLYRHHRMKQADCVLIIPGGSLHQFILAKVQCLEDTSWKVQFQIAGIGWIIGLRRLIGCWMYVIQFLLGHGLGNGRSTVAAYPIVFRVQAPRKEGLLRTDLLIDGKSISSRDVLFFLKDSQTDRGREMCQFLKDQEYHYVALSDLACPVQSLPRIIKDYVLLPLRGFLVSLTEGETDSCFPLLASVSQQMILSKFDLLLDHSQCNVLVSCHSAGSEMMTARLLCQRQQTQFLVYNFGTTMSQVRWAAYAFSNAHAFFAWGPDVLAVYKDTLDVDRVIHTGFWGYPEYQKALEERDHIRTTLNINPESRLVVFYDIPYFSDRSSFMATLLYSFYRVALACSRLRDTAVILKMKSHHNENTSIYPVELRAKFQELWGELKCAPNINICVTKDWDPLHMIAASDANVTLELSSPSTLALLCGKPGFFLNTAKDHVYHPLNPKYENTLIFSDAELLLLAIKRCLDDGVDTNLLLQNGDLSGFNEGSDKAGLERFRREMVRLAGMN